MSILRLSLVLVAVALARPASAQGLPADLAAVPPAALGFVHVRIADLLKHKSLADYRKLFEKAGDRALTAFDGQFAPRPSSLDRVTAVVLPGQRPEEIFAAVLHFTQPFDLAAVRASYLPGAEAVKNSAKPLFVDKLSGTALFAPDPQTLVVGPADTILKVYLAAPAEATPHPLKAALAAAAAGTKAVYAAVNVANLSLPAEALEQIPEPFRPLIAAESVTLSVALADSATVSLNAVYADDAAAVAAEKSMKQGAEMLRKLIAQYRQQPEAALFGKAPVKGFRKLDEMPDALGAVAQIAALNFADDLLADLPVKRAGNVLAATVELPPMMTAYVGLSSASLGLLVPAVQKVREAAARQQSTNNLQQIALAVHSYHDANGAFPPAAIVNKKGKPLLSWRVMVLPYLEQNALYEQFKLDEPWDSEHNLPLGQVVIKVYTDPRSTAAQGLTHYKVFVGKDAGFPLLKGRTIASIADGTSNTIMAVAAGDAVPWSKPEDFEFDMSKPAPDLSKPFPVILAAFMDGSVRAIDPSGFVKNKDLLKWLINPADGNVIPDF
jgi:hypothetical protein